MLKPSFFKRASGVTRLGLMSVCGIFSFGYMPIANSQTLPEGTDKVVDFCSTCHGKDGISHLESIPNLYGQSEAYLANQIRAMRDKKRHTEFMAAFISQISDEQIKAASSYYGSLPVDKNEIKLQWRGEKWPGDMSLGEKIAYVGKPEQNVPACVTCHGPNGVGVQPVIPRLAGQNTHYIENQMISWQKDERPQDSLNLMPPIAKGLTADEIKAVAIYFSEQGSIQKRVKDDEKKTQEQIDAELKMMESKKAASALISQSSNKEGQ